MALKQRCAAIAVRRKSPAIHYGRSLGHPDDATTNHINTYRLVVEIRGLTVGYWLGSSLVLETCSSRVNLLLGAQLLVT